MTPLIRHLANYGAYHRDRRNLATHAVGIPLIVLAVEVLLSRPVLDLAGLPLTPAIVASVVAGAFYLRLDIQLGILMSVLLALMCWAGSLIAAGSTAVWLGSGIGLFVFGWALQFVGHFFEGRKPAFTDDLKSLLIGPLFVAAEAVFALGLRKDLRDAVEARVEA